MDVRSSINSSQHDQAIRKTDTHKSLDVEANLFVGDQEVDEKLIYDTFSAFGVIVTNPKPGDGEKEWLSCQSLLLSNHVPVESDNLNDSCDLVLMALVTEELLILYESMKITDALTRVHKNFQGDPVLMALVTEEMLILYESMQITDALIRVHKNFQDASEPVDVGDLQLLETVEEEDRWYMDIVEE
ncbi:hypothetical protein Tco_0836203 [Tanacetum coccineum]